MPTEAEWLTRKSRIDTRLKQDGWHLVRFTPELDVKALDTTAVEEFPTANGPADYALFVKGQLLGIVEAKKVGVSPQNVLERIDTANVGNGVPSRKRSNKKWKMGKWKWENGAAREKNGAVSKHLTFELVWISDRCGCRRKGFANVPKRLQRGWASRSHRQRLQFLAEAIHPVHVLLCVAHQIRKWQDNNR